MRTPRKTICKQFVAGWRWGTAFIDFDNDRDLGLVATNGFDFAQFRSDAVRVLVRSGSAARRQTFSGAGAATVSRALIFCLRQRRLAISSPPRSGVLRYRSIQTSASGAAVRVPRSSPLNAPFLAALPHCLQHPVHSETAGRNRFSCH